LCKTPTDGWREIKHYIFEVPHDDGGLFERLAKVKAYESSIIKIVSQAKIKNKEYLKKFLDEVERKGGEGVVVRDPHTPYIDKRTSKALKVKRFQDAECEVLGYTKGHGKFSDVIGAIECQLEDGTRFKIGTGLR